MTASSGLPGFCVVCEHANNEHRPYYCTVPRCGKLFMVCHIKAHSEVDQPVWVLCLWYPDHPYSCPIDVTNMPRLEI
ncbi:hypothetical protein BO94DRAFT_477792 [Aspergillus sclerotioniger CBS 115572]|uniref:Uncharacterized protein n=1 Tax=Aspergillus sclerotioniger CBS 115572 TaxID=1450535 RepID=A0A317V9Q3_9EURO|nr:hypothetical protein BO94DRAFT_477792 [Aspergillus sclerotioniger CBS 115572]PWY69602.1 hypothetical protein BO94DRAFT_477792 [Aspergillus sclerotioniger CBS 115572]